MAAKTKKAEQKPYTLVIVESPAKAKTIEKFLGAGYKVTASNGHLIDLPKSKIGVDVENGFEPSYIVIRGRTSLLNALKKEAASADRVLLATDPDREGEAISWHIAGALKLEDNEPCRIEFNEITKTAVSAAIEHPRSIDLNRVNAQQARRVLDRLVGYKLSPLLWNKIRRGLSAGRVQSVAVRIIVDREREIKEFKPREFWTITVLLKNESGTEVEARFFGKGGKKFEPENKEQTNEILEAIKGAVYTVEGVKRGSKQRRPLAPFTTSTLQQDAAGKLGYTTKRTMIIAQGLYEGVKLGNDTAGLITYMRTDSTRISKEAQQAAKEALLERYGAEYVPEKFNVYAGRKNAQDAHEAIRPTYIQYTPERVAQYLTPDQLKLYSLIYRRFLASQMTPARYDTLAYDIKAAGYDFKASFTRLSFDGYRAVYQENVEEKEPNMPALEKGDKCTSKKVTPKQNFTQPPARFTEASLVKTLEEKGIGRPSTYSPIISTIVDRQYVNKEQKSLVPTELGEIVTDLMMDNFSEIVSLQFTAEMEEKLDDIESEGKNWKDIIAGFYFPFEDELKRAEKEVKRVELPERPAGVVCELCGAEMVYKVGRFGEFIACPKYPECKNTKPIKKPIKTPCPLCGGTVVLKRSKKGKGFYGCDSYPECTFVSWDMPVEEKCPECNSYMVQKKGKGDTTYNKCSNPECSTNAKSVKSDTKATRTATKSATEKSAAKKATTKKTAVKKDTPSKATTKSATTKATAKKADTKTAKGTSKPPNSKTEKVATDKL